MISRRVLVTAIQRTPRHALYNSGARFERNFSQNRFNPEKSVETQVKQGWNRASETAKEAKDYVEEKAQQGMNRASETWNEAKDSMPSKGEVKNAMNYASRKAGDAYQEGKEAVKETAEEFREGRNDTWETTKDMASDAWNKAKDLGSQAIEKVEEVGSQAWQAAKKTSNRVTSDSYPLDSYNSTEQDLKEKGRFAKKEAQSTYESIKEKAADTYENMKDKAEVYFEDAKDKKDDVADAMKKEDGYMGKAKAAVKEAVYGHENRPGDRK
jgi:hypothetical protein